MVDVSKFFDVYLKVSNDRAPKRGEFNLLLSKVMVGQTLNKSTYVFSGRTEQFLSMQILLLGLSSIGKTKVINSSMNIAGLLFKRINELTTNVDKHFDLNIISINSGSTEKIAEILSSYKGAGIWYTDEYGSLLKMMRNYSPQLEDLENKIYDGAPFIHSSFSNEAIIPDTRLSRVCGTTREVIHKYGGFDLIKTGYFARYLIYNLYKPIKELIDDSHILYSTKPETGSDQIEFLVQCLAKIMELKLISYKTWGLRLNKKHIRWLGAFNQKLSDYVQGDEIYYPIIQRYAEYVLKLAGINTIVYNYDTIRKNLLNDNVLDLRNVAVQKVIFKEETFPPKTKKGSPVIKDIPKIITDSIEVPIIAEIQDKSMKEAIKLVRDCFISVKELHESGTQNPKIIKIRNALQATSFKTFTTFQ